MGRIREYNNTQTINPSPLDQAAYRVEKTGMIQGAAMRETGAAGARVINRFEDSIAQGETSDLAKKMSDLDLQTTQAYEDEKQKGDMSDPDFASKFVEKHLQPNLDKLGEDLLTPEAQKMYQQASLKLTSEYTKRAISDQATFAGNKAITDYKSQITTYSNLSTNDPTTTDHNAEMIRIAAKALPAEHRDALTKAALAANYESGGKGYLQAAIKNPNATLQTLDAAWEHVADKKNGFVDNMDPDAYAALKSQYETARMNLNAVNSAKADINFGDILKQVSGNGGNDVNGAGQALIDSYQGKTAAETQLWKAEHQKQYDEAMSFGKATVGVATMPEPELIDKITSTQAAIDKAAPGDIGKLTAQRDAMMASYKQRSQEFAKDQAAYVLQNSPVVASRYQDYLQKQTPESFANFAQASIAEQQRLYPGVTPALVTVDMAATIGNAVSSVPATPEGATQLGSVLRKYSKDAGQYWPQIAQELYHDKVLNPNQFVAASMWGKPDALGLAQDLLRASVMKPEDFSKTTTITEGQGDKFAKAALAPLALTLHDAANGGQLMSAYEGALATLIRAKGDKNAGAAIAAKMIMGEYQFRGTLRMPTNVDASAVVSGTKSVQADLGNHKIIVPPSYSGLGPHDQHALYIRAVQENGHWSTSGDGKTALLYDEQGTPVYETMHGHRAQVALDWKTLQKLGSGHDFVSEASKAADTTPNSMFEK
jgi:hypothetical protein